MDARRPAAGGRCRRCEVRKIAAGPEGAGHRRQLRHRPGRRARARQGRRRRRGQLRAPTREQAEEVVAEIRDDGGKALSPTRPTSATRTRSQAMFAQHDRASSARSTSWSTTPACSRTRRFEEMTLAAVEHGDRRQPHRPVPVRPRGGARVQAPRRAARGLLRRRQDHLHELGARGHPLGRPRQLRGLQGRRDADDEEHRAGGRAATASASTASARARSARRSTRQPGTRPRPTPS